jgi:hypothetical protein
VSDNLERLERERERETEFNYTNMDLDGFRMTTTGTMVVVNEGASDRGVVEI